MANTSTSLLSINALVTLPRILRSLCYKKFDGQDNFYNIIVDDDGFTITKYDTSPQVLLFKWNKRDYLHQQTQETIDNIVKLLSSDEESCPLEELISSLQAEYDLDTDFLVNDCYVTRAVKEMLSSQEYILPEPNLKIYENSF